MHLVHTKMNKKRIVVVCPGRGSYSRDTESYDIKIDRDWKPSPGYVPFYPYKMRVINKCNHRTILGSNMRKFTISAKATKYDIVIADSSIYVSNFDAWYSRDGLGSDSIVSLVRFMKKTKLRKADAMIVLDFCQTIGVIGSFER